LHAIALLLFVLTLPAQAAAADLIPYERVASRVGPPVVLIAAPTSPWAVVQLHVRLQGDAIPAELRARGEQLAQALAAGRAEGASSLPLERLLQAGGELRYHVDEDELVVSVGVPTTSLHLALETLAERVRSRRRLLPPRPEDPIAPLAAPARVPRLVRELLAPAHSYAQPVVTDAPPDALALRQLADLLLRRDGMVYVVLAPLESPRARALALARLDSGPLPAGAPAGGPLAPPAGNRVVENVRLDHRARGPFTWLWWQTPGLEGSSPQRRAAFAVLARLLGAEQGMSGAAGWLSWHAPLLAPAGAPAAEEARLARLEALASTPPDAEALRRARLGVHGDALHALARPEGAALALGAGELLAGDAGEPLRTLLALDDITAAEVALAARSLLEGPRLVVRGIGAAAGEAP
jgi:hypothetical protein